MQVVQVCAKHLKNNSLLAKKSGIFRTLLQQLPVKYIFFHVIESRNIKNVVKITSSLTAQFTILGESIIIYNGLNL